MFLNENENNDVKIIILLVLLIKSTAISVKIIALDIFNKIVQP